MLVDHEKVLAKAYELLPRALNDMATEKLKQTKNANLSQLEISLLNYGILRGVLQIAGQGRPFDDMVAIIKINEKNDLHVRIYAKEAKTQEALVD